MHDLLESVQEINLDHFEYAILVEDTPKGASTFKLYIPKLMPLVQTGDQTASQWKEEVRGDIFVNDAQCKIDHMKTVTCQNYITVSRYSDSDFSARANINGIIPKGTKFIIHSLYGNYNDLYVFKVL